MKKLSEQTIVITGASSGIGLATARMAAERGARVVLTSRNENELRRIVDEIRREGGQAIYVAADMADEEQVRHVADAAIEAFGGFDTWVNNAAVSIYGSVLDVPIEDQRQLFETNFWGYVHGAKVAVDHLRRRGGTLIDIGSIVSERSIPQQGTYAASKHAVKAWMDALRMELMEQDAPVAVVLIEPGSIDTPFTQHARNFMDREPQLPPPIYAPEVVARAILHCAEKPQARLVVGGAGRGFTIAEKVAPGLTDRMMAGTLTEQQKKARPPGRGDALYGPPAREGEVRGHNRGLVMQHSGTTWAAEHKGTTAMALGAALLGGVLAAAAGGLLATSGGKEQPRRTDRHRDLPLGTRAGGTTQQRTEPWRAPH